MQYTSDYDKLVYLATHSNESVQENALRLITNITTEGSCYCLLFVVDVDVLMC